MYLKTAALFVIAVAGCAGSQRSAQVDSLTRSTRSEGLYVGHSTNGDVVLAANHYDAMSGLATTADELGLPTAKNEDGAMLCAREMPTGTHVPRWVCRYEQSIREERQATQDMLDAPRLSFSGKGGNMAVLLGRSGGNWSRGPLVP